jgi:hypothetical protein
VLRPEKHPLQDGTLEETLLFGPGTIQLVPMLLVPPSLPGHYFNFLFLRIKLVSHLPCIKTCYSDSSCIEN